MDTTDINQNTINLIFEPHLKFAEHDELAFPVVGEVVRLNCGGPLLTVTKVEYYNSDSSKPVLQFDAVYFNEVTGLLETVTLTPICCKPA